jgi:hypothetical protein
MPLSIAFWNGIFRPGESVRWIERRPGGRTTMSGVGVLRRSDSLAMRVVLGAWFGQLGAPPSVRPLS